MTGCDISLQTCSGGDDAPAPSEIEINWQYANAVENPVPGLPADNPNPEQLLPQPRTLLNVDADGYVLCSETMECIGDLADLLLKQSIVARFAKYSI